MSSKTTFRVSPTLGDLAPSMTLTITSQAKAMVAAGEDVVSLSAGEPDFDTPQHIKDAAVAALVAGDTKYTPIAGTPKLRQAIADKLVNENHVPASADTVVVSPGAKFSVFAAVAALCTTGDEVMIPTPYWLSYPEMVKGAGATSVFVETDDTFCLTPETLEKAITPRTKLLILNSPSNPTGSVYTRDQLAAIAELALRHNFMILADEIYEKLVYDADHTHVSIASLGQDVADHTITVNGFSKAYAMTGWRLGYLTAPAWLSKCISSLQSHTTSNPTSFAQAGALAAIQGPQDPVETMRLAFAERRDLIDRRLREIPGITVARPTGAFYIFPDISASGLDSMVFAERILKEAKLAVVPGRPFGMDTHIRLSYACSQETINKGCDRLAAFMESL